MDTINAPYNFAPLSRFIVRPDWAELVSHDHPFADGLSGELSLELQNHTRLCVGGKQDSATESAPGRVHFYRTPDGSPAIPGSSLKGMLRAVTEIATFSHFRQVEERRLGVRDMSKADNFYFRNAHGASVRSGWLTFDKGQWLLTPCKFVRLHQQDLITHFNIDEKQWTNGNYNAAVARYRLLKGLNTLNFDQEAHKRHTCGIAKNLGRGSFEGTLVMTGQPGAHFKRNNKAKKWEFIFYAADMEKQQPVAASTMADFQFIHSESDEWEYWRQQLGNLDQGVPVFYHAKPDGSPRSMGLSMMYRLAYEHSLHDAIGHTQEAHLDAESVDMADLIFGRIDPQGKSSLRGRVAVSDGELSSVTPELSFTVPTVLNGPKPSFYPAYIRQRSSGDYLTLMDKNAELSGWKRYPVKAENIQVPQGDTAKNNKVQVQLETLAKGSIFSSKLRFHNLRPVELGALLWAIDFGGREDLRHGLGMGKPYGLGQVCLKVSADACRIRPNDPDQEVADNDLFLSACRHVFDDFMQTALGQAVGGSPMHWEKNESIRQLLAMANPEESEGVDHLQYWQEPRSFSTAKTDQLKLQLYAGAASESHEPASSWQPNPVANGCDLGQGLAQAKQEQQEKSERARREQEKWERVRAKESMAQEDRLLAEVEDWEGKHREVPLTKTDSKKFERAFKQAEAELMSNPDYQSSLLTMAKKLDSCGIKLVEKIAKRVIKNLANDESEE